RQSVLHQFPRCLGQQHLSTMPSAHNACGVVHIQADIAVSSPLRLACVQTDAYRYCHIFRKGMGGESALCRHSCRHGIGGASEDHEKGIALGVHDAPIPLSERCTQHLAALRQHTGISLTQLVQQARGPRNIGEQQRDRTSWQVLHDRPPCAAPVGTADFNDKMDSTSRAVFPVCSFALHDSLRDTGPSTANLLSEHFL
ncbi:MAG TPA: hypothetical protein VKU38_02860, partial [Ktedonobacteraceae bacterium]|nr:hypothetical protein [Ktedonobacteraceae bacterium]